MNEIQDHWNTAYDSSVNEKLGWYEPSSVPSLSLISEITLPDSAHILHVGSGKSNLTESLIALGYHNLTLTDISDKALNAVRDRLENIFLPGIKFIQDDITNPTNLLEIDPVDLWHDRAVLHFFTELDQQNVYFELLKSKVKIGGYVILAEFQKEIGATKCSGLNVCRYDSETFQSKLGEKFKLLKDFSFTYYTPSGAERPYVYALFQRLK
jgi:SAM-dependent methyltransferase